MSLGCSCFPSVSWGLGFRVWGLGFRVLGFGVSSLWIQGIPGWWLKDSGRDGLFVSKFP